MKFLILIASIILLFVSEVSAQIVVGLDGNRATALKYKGKYVYVEDTVAFIKIINSSYASVTSQIL